MNKETKNYSNSLEIEKERDENYQNNLNTNIDYY